MSISNRKHRESNFELLRIIAILFVIATHYYLFYGGLENAASDIVSAYLSQIIFVLSKTCVNLFLLISGYFMIKGSNPKWGKLLSLLVMSMLNMPLYQAVTNWHDGYFSPFDLFYYFLPSSYYINIFCAVYLLSPFINKALQFSKNTQTRMIIAAITLFCVWPNVINLLGWHWNHTFSCTYPTSFYGNEGGLTFLNFTLFYLIGAYMRLHKPLAKVPISWRVVSIIAIPCALAAFGIRIDGLITTDAFTGYDSIFVLVLSVLIFSLFEDRHVQYSPAINFMAKGTLWIYITHESLLSVIAYYIRIFDHLPQGCTAGLGYVALSIGCIICTWIVAFITYLIVRLIFSPLLRWWEHTRLYRLNIYRLTEAEHDCRSNRL